MAKNHVCVEGEVLGIDMGGYPRAIMYCEDCRRELRRVPVDELDGSRFEHAMELIEYIRSRRSKR